MQGRLLIITKKQHREKPGTRKIKKGICLAEGNNIKKIASNVKKNGVNGVKKIFNMIKNVIVNMAKNKKMWYDAKQQSVEQMKKRKRQHGQVLAK